MNSLFPTMFFELRPVIMYVRMSTQHQLFSTENQSQVIEEYAKRHGHEIVKSVKESNPTPRGEL